jgi:hypothetical protein
MSPSEVRTTARPKKAPIRPTGANSARSGLHRELNCNTIARAISDRAHHGYLALALPQLLRRPRTRPEPGGVSRPDRLAPAPVLRRQFAQRRERAR